MQREHLYRFGTAVFSILIGLMAYYSMSVWPKHDLTGKTVAILVGPGAYEPEVRFASQFFRKAGACVMIIGPEKGEVRGSAGNIIKVDRQVGEVTPGSFDCLVIPGSDPALVLRDLRDAIDLVHESLRHEKLVAVAGGGAHILIEGGLVDGRRVTAAYSMKDDLIAAGAIYQANRVVRDGQLVTSKGPVALRMMCSTIVEVLARLETTGAINQPCPTFDFARAQ